MKITGCIILFCVTLFCCGYIVWRERKRMEQSAAFRRLFEFVYERCKYYQMPLKEIYESFADETLEKTGILEILRKGERGLPYSNFFVTAFDKCKEEFCFSQKESALIREFGSVLKTIAYDECERLEYYLNDISKQDTFIKSEFSKRVKLKVSLSLAAGFALIILII